MRKLCLGIVLLASTMMTLSSKAEAQGGEIFGGYSYLRRTGSGAGYNSNGWEGSLTGNFNRFLGLEVDLSDHYNTPPGLGTHSNGFSFLFGPHVAYRSIPKVNPFVHFLVGGTRGSARATLTEPCPTVGCPISILTLPSQTAFTVGFGGGVDLKASRFVWIRLVQVDYLREYFSGDTQNNARVSFGVVLRFGR